MPALEAPDMKSQILLTVLVALLCFGHTTFATAAPAEEEAVALAPDSGRP
jgi:hypothetical protein